MNVELIGIPFDGKSSYMAGPRFAPARIREELHSSSYNAFAESGNSILGSEKFEDRGDIDASDYNLISQGVQALLTNSARPLFLGGDHAITYQLVKAMHGIHGPIHILHFDAHGDLYDELDGDRFSHACPFARILEEGLASSLTQVGVRSYTPEQLTKVAEHGVTTFEMRHIQDYDPSIHKDPIYISLDLDVLDPAFAPGISHREPGGPDVRTLLGWIQNIQAPIIGADLVEYNPLRDIDGLTASVCFKLVKELADRMIYGN